MGKLAGRKALVTGADSGIGAAAVAMLQAEGAIVMACDIAGEGLAGDHNHVADLATLDAITALAAAAESALGGLDILVNNAGVCPVGTLDDQPDGQWQFALDINLLAPMRLTRACLPMLRQSGCGRVINTGSIMSSYGHAALGAYASSKHAILGLTRSLANELGAHAITVNCVQPGCIVTGMTREMLQDEAATAYYRENAPLKRLGQPEDVAGLMVFLASDAASFITGQGIFVDGGIMTHS